jgi:hypothetical protein
MTPVYRLPSLLYLFHHSGASFQVAASLRAVFQTMNGLSIERAPLLFGEPAEIFHEGFGDVSDSQAGHSCNLQLL